MAAESKETAAKDTIQNWALVSTKPSSARSMRSTDPEILIDSNEDWSARHSLNKERITNPMGKIR